MSRLLFLAAAATLLSVTACSNPSEEAAKPESSQSEAASRPVEPAAPASTEAPSVEASAPTPIASDAVAPGAKPEEPGQATVEHAGLLTREQAMVLARKGNCLACHTIDSKLVGPAWKNVGAKYRDDANAAATIASHIKAGGSFGWKFGVMPPRGGSTISDADIDSLAKFIASLK